MSLTRISKEITMAETLSMKGFLPCGGGQGGLLTKNGQGSYGPPGRGKNSEFGEGLPGKKIRKKKGAGVGREKLGRGGGVNPGGRGSRPPCPPPLPWQTSVVLLFIRWFPEFLFCGKCFHFPFYILVFTSNSLCWVYIWIVSSPDNQHNHCVTRQPQWQCHVTSYSMTSHQGHMTKQTHIESFGMRLN